jgi:Hemerythrin HHE cation binding domain
MARTDKFRSQHAELVQAAADFSKLLSPAQLGKDGGPARQQLAQLAGKLNVHLAMEDKSLYPGLLRHKDPAVQAKAKKFIDEMGGIKKAFAAYSGKWPSAAAIQANAGGFVQETQALFGVLAQRIQAEDNDLYKLVDALG